MPGERRKDAKDFRNEVLTRMDVQDSFYATLSGRVGKIEDELVVVQSSLVTNTNITQQIADDTSAIREIQNEVGSAVRLLCRFARWWRFLIRYIAAPIGMIVALPWLIWYWVAHDYTLPIWVQRLLEIWK